MEEALRTWSEFSVAMVGAAAALAGLVIVAASVNIAKIIAFGGGSLIARLASGIASLVLALVASGLALIPGITAPWFGTILIVATAGSAAFTGARRAAFWPSSPRSWSPGSPSSRCCAERSVRLLPHDRGRERRDRRERWARGLVVHEFDRCTRDIAGEDVRTGRTRAQ